MTWSADYTNKVAPPNPVRRGLLLQMLTLPIAAWSLEALAQRHKTIGFLNGSRSFELRSRVDSFLDGLRSTGWIADENVKVEYRWGEGKYDALPKLAAELAALRPAVIAATGGVASVQAARNATSSIPIVFTMGADPVKLNLVANLHRPGGNVTGVTLLAGPLAAKRVELLREMRPRMRTLGILYYAESPGSLAELDAAQIAAQSLGLKSVPLMATSDTLVATLAFAHSELPDGILVTTDPIFESKKELIVAMIEKLGVPAIYSLREYAAIGGLMSYGASIDGVYRQAGRYVGRILGGERVGELPVQLPTEFALTVNSKSAKLFGVDVPTHLLALATEVIE